jgi:hypothetical protein
VAFRATVLRVLIASPSDTANARSLLREVVDDGLHAEDSQIVARRSCRRRCHPELGDRPGRS